MPLPQNALGSLTTRTIDSRSAPTCVGVQALKAKAVKESPHSRFSYFRMVLIWSVQSVSTYTAKYFA